MNLLGARSSAGKPRKQKQECELDTCTACCERHAVLVLLLRVQHAQGHRQLPPSVRYDGEGQLAALALLTVVCQDVLVRIQPKCVQSAFTPSPLVSRRCTAQPHLGPRAVVLHAVDGEGDHFDPPFPELAAQSGSSTQLCGANRSVVSGVGEQDPPPRIKRARRTVSNCGFRQMHAKEKGQTPLKAEAAKRQSALWFTHTTGCTRFVLT